MIEIVRQRELNLPIEQVWPLVESVERLPAWYDGCHMAERLSGGGLGRRQRLHGQWGRHRFEIDQTVTAYEPQQLLAWQHDAERFDGRPAPRISRHTELHIELHPVGQGTRVRLVSRQVPASFLKSLVLRLMARRVARMLDRSLEKLAEVLSAEFR